MRAEKVGAGTETGASDFLYNFLLVYPKP